MSLADTLSTADLNHSQTPTISYVDGIPSSIFVPSAPQASTQAEFNHILADLGVPIPDGYELQLVEARKNMHAWTRDSVNQELATTRPNWTYRFKVVPVSNLLGKDDVQELYKQIAGMKPHKVAKNPVDGSCYVVALADFQVGKGSNGDGGTEALIERVQTQLSRMVADYKTSGASSVFIVDLGDNSCENEHNTASQLGTNDLQFIDQLRVWSRLLLKIVTTFAKLSDEVTVAGVPSNHSQHRHNGKAVGDAHNDYGLLALSNLQDALALNEKAFGHVKFAYPDTHKESLTVKVGGTYVGCAHGHQSGSPDKIPDFISKQIAGRQPLQFADIILTGHFHHLRVQNIVGNRWWFQGPANDAGSAWFTQRSGEYSSPGVLTFTVLDGVWSNLKVV